MATDEEAAEAIFDAIVNVAKTAATAEQVNALADAYEKMTDDGEDKTEPDKGVTPLTGADMLAFDPSGTWYDHRGLGFTPRGMPKSTGRPPVHHHPEVFS